MNPLSPVPPRRPLSPNSTDSRPLLRFPRHLRRPTVYVRAALDAMRVESSAENISRSLSIDSLPIIVVVALTAATLLFSSP